MALKLKISQKELDGLKNYKYAALDRSLITKYIMKPYWDWAVTLFPLWIAPNLITLIGFGFIIINFVTMLIFTPDLQTPAPGWVYISFAIGLHLYQTFDNVDGRQARRTGSSSPLGELFDHGCDALNSSIGAIIQAAATGFGFSWRTPIMLFATIGAFYVSTWEEYHTHVLQFGYINGPVEGILTGCVIMAVSGFLGTAFWHQPLVDVLDMAYLSAARQWIPNQLIFCDLLLGFLVFCFFFVQIPTSVIAVYYDCKAHGKSFFGTLFGLIPYVVYAGACYAWLAAPGSRVLQDHLVVFAVACGVCFGRMATKIITAYVCGSSFPYFTVQLLPLLFGAVNANLPILGIPSIIPLDYEGLMVWSYLVFTIVHYSYWANEIIQSFCKHLKIKAFVIPKKAL